MESLLSIVEEKKILSENFNAIFSKQIESDEFTGEHVESYLSDNILSAEVVDKDFAAISDKRIPDSSEQCNKGVRL